METIKEATKENYRKTIKSCDGSKNSGIQYVEELINKSFENGIKFAQQWISIERDKDGLISSKQEKEFINNLPFLIKSKYNIQVIEEMTMDLEKTNYTYWRPIELK